MFDDYSPPVRVLEEIRRKRAHLDVRHQVLETTGGVRGFGGPYADLEGVEEPVALRRSRIDPASEQARTLDGDPDAVVAGIARKGTSGAVEVAGHFHGEQQHLAALPPGRDAQPLTELVARLRLAPHDPGRERPDRAV